MDAADRAARQRLHDLRATGTVIGGVSHDSRTVRDGDLYACLRGDSFDGHDFAEAAVRAGATVLLVDHELPPSVAGGAAQVVVDDTRRRLGPIAAEIAGHPSRRLTTVGVTGTNGKTTTTHLLAAVLEAAGRPTGIIGTLAGTRTTPEAPELQAALAGFVEEGRRAAVLEVSSHALALHRVDGTEFDAVVFTNLGRDHLDLHGTTEEYFRAKARLFDPSFSSLGVVNVDDPYGRVLADAASSDAPPFTVVPVSIEDAADVEVEADRHRYRWRGVDVEVPLGGLFNVANSLAALTTAVELGVDVEAARAGLAGAATVPGRFEVITDGEITVVVDYAHTPDGLAGLLESAAALAGPRAGGAVTVVFGCGGDRDVDKRPQMGAVAEAGADRVIVTSDNPRHEDPATIIGQIVAGAADPGGLTAIVDRREAIAHAVSIAARGDVVVIAGKGHETTQDLGDRVVDFDDRAVARALLEERS